MSSNRIRGTKLRNPNEVSLQNSRRVPATPIVNTSTGINRRSSSSLSGVGTRSRGFPNGPRLANPPRIELTRVGGGDAPSTSAAIAAVNPSTDKPKPKLRGRNTTTSSCPMQVNESPYFRGVDATGLFMDRPPSRSMTHAHDLPLLLEVDNELEEELKASKDLLERTAEHTFYSTRLKYGKLSNVGTELENVSTEQISSGLDEVVEDAEYSFRPISAGYHSEGDTEMSAPIDNPRFTMPPSSANKDKSKAKATKSGRSRNYSSVYGMNTLTIEDEDDDSESESTSSSSSSDEESNEGESSSNSSTSGGSGESQQSESVDKGEKVNAELAKKKKQLHKLRLGEKMLTEKTRSTFQQVKGELKKQKLLRSDSEEHLQIQSNPFIHELRDRKSALGSDLDHMKVELSKLKATFAGNATNVGTGTSAKKISKVPRTVAATRGSGSLSEKLESVFDAPKTASVINKNPKKKAASPNTSEGKQKDVNQIVENIKNLRQDVLKILPPKSEGKKFLMGNKSILTTAPSNVSSSTELKGRRFTNLASTKTGLTPATGSSSSSPSLLDPIDDELRKSMLVRAASLRKLERTKAEAETLKQKLGIKREGTTLGSLVSGSRNARGLGTADMAGDSIYLAAKLRMPNRGTTGNKTALQEFQARDAERVAARRRAIQESVDRKKNKYLLSNEELKSKIQSTRPSMLMNPTKGWTQRTEIVKSEKLNTTYQKTFPQNHDDFKSSRLQSPAAFKPKPSVTSITKRATPSWKGI